MKKKRLISLLLSLVMAMALMPTAFAAYSYHMDVTAARTPTASKQRWLPTSTSWA